jgi:hypothetical protein
MKYILLFNFCYLLSFVSNAQITNPSFEEWITESNYLVPLGWRTNNTLDPVIRLPVTKDTFLSDGKYAMKIESIGWSFPPYGLATTTFKAIAINNVLSFDYLVDSIRGNGSINIKVHIGNTQNGFYQIVFNQDIKESNDIIGKIEVPIIMNNIDSVQITILAKAANNDLSPWGHASIIIDNMKIESATKVSNQDKKNQQILIYPNPSKGDFTIEGGENASFALYTTDGKLVNYGLLKNGNFQIEEKGLFILLIRRDGNLSKKYLLTTY